MKKLTAFLSLGVLLATMLVLVSAVAAANPAGLDDFVRLDGAILYAAAFEESMLLSISHGGVREAQLVQANVVVHNDASAAETITVELKSFPETADTHFELKPKKPKNGYALLIARLVPGARVKYRIGSADEGELQVPANAPEEGKLTVDWPVFEAGCTGTGQYTVEGTLPIRRIGTRYDKDHSTYLARYAYWPETDPDSLLHGTMVFTSHFDAAKEEPGSGEPRELGSVIYSFPPCPASVRAWLAKSPARVVPDRQVGLPPARAPITTTPTAAGTFPVLPIAAAAGTAALVAGATLPRRVVDVWLEAGDAGITVRRGRRGPGRIRAVVTFLDGGREERQEVVLARGESQEIEAPEGWQAVALATPGRRNRGAPTRLEREAV